ncbi:MAG: 50S ribosomal protein L32 [Cytophagales bacterium]|jgi:large subunit ribosomal protein L32|nr:50S ribosomal protein L32 [Cytophagales bacterium]
MPVPKRRHSSTRRDKRRTHDSLRAPLLTSCPVSGIFHRPHVAYWVENSLYYRGVKVVEDEKKSKDVENKSEG